MDAERARGPQVEESQEGDERGVGLPVRPVEERREDHGVAQGGDGEQLRGPLQQPHEDRLPCGHESES